MPALMTWGGVAVAVLGVLLAIAGMPDRAAGFGLGSDLIQTGATLIAGGLVLSGIGQAVRAINVLIDRVEELPPGFGARNTFNDDLIDEAPAPLPRAAERATARETPAAITPRTPASPERAAPSEFEDEYLDEPKPRQPRVAREQPQQPAAVPEARPQRPQLSREPRSANDQAVPRVQPQARGSAPRAPEFERDAKESFERPEQTEPRRESRWSRSPQSQTPAPPQAAAPSRGPLERPTRGPAAMSPEPRPRETQAPLFDPRRRQQPGQEFEPEQPRQPNGAPRQPRQFPEEPVDDVGSVVRSGIIGGMAYTLYSDGSIEAELPIGTVRFNSLQELQEHVQRAGAEADGDFRGRNTPH